MRLAALLAAIALTMPAAARAQDAAPGVDTAESGDASGEDASGEDASGEDASGEDAGHDASSEDANDQDASGAEPRTRRSDEPDANVPSTNASGVLGIVTILATVGAVAGVGTWIEREDNVARCAAYELETPRYRGCLNVGALRDQRDVGMGLTIGFGALAVGAAVAWAIVAATASPTTERAVVCAPGLLSFGCAGRF